MSLSNVWYLHSVCVVCVIKSFKPSLCVLLSSTASLAEILGILLVFLVLYFSALSVDVYLFIAVTKVILCVFSFEHSFAYFFVRHLLCSIMQCKLTCGTVLSVSCTVFIVAWCLFSVTFYARLQLPDAFCLLLLLTITLITLIKPKITLLFIDVSSSSGRQYVRACPIRGSSGSSRLDSCCQSS